MKKIAGFIVRFQYLVLTIFLCLLVYSGLSIKKVNIEYDISAYLPSSTDTAQAIEIMDKEFTTYGTTIVVVDNISYQKAYELKEEILKLDGVKSLPFENTQKYFNNSKALFKVTFEGNASDPVSVKAYNDMKELLSPYKSLESVSLVDNYADSLAHDMKFIVLLAAVVIILVLLFTSRSYAEVIVLPIVFIVAAILNMGTNYWFGTISFVSNSICIILQLALAIDYSIILLHRFIEECEGNPERSKKNSMIEALSKSIPEILGSSLTTISGLMALTCMTFSLGKDLGFVLTKAILWSIVTVLFLMPCLLLMFSNAIEKTRHKNFVPKIDFVGKSIVKVRYLIVVLFLGLVGVGAYLNFKVDYCYTNNGIEGFHQTEVQKANKVISENFGYQNQFVIVIPNGDYAKQKEILRMMEKKPYINEALGLANIEVKDGYYLCDSINYQDLVKILNIDRDLSKMLFYYYAFEHEDYSIIVNNNIDTYKVTIIDLLDTVFKLKDENFIQIPADIEEDFNKLRDELEDGKKQLLGPNYSRMVFNLNKPEEGKETFATIDELTKEIKAMCPEAICGGNSMVAYDLNSSFMSDNLIISILTIAFVFIILLFNFHSWGLPILLVLVIQGAIFINFGIPVLMSQNLFFFVYLIANAIQMGATIDYAIVISGRYTELRKTEDKKTSVVKSLTEAFPTIISSGAILVIAALLIGVISSDLLISSIGYTISRGTIISILSVMLVLPVLLYIFDKPLKYTMFKSRKKKKTKMTREEKSLLMDITRTFYLQWKEIERNNETKDKLIDTSDDSQDLEENIEENLAEAEAKEEENEENSK